MAGMYTLLNMLLLRAMKRLSFRIDELDCNLAPQCLHVAKPCLWCGFHFHPVPIKNVLVFLMSCKQLRNTWRTIVFRNANVKEIRSICLLPATFRDARSTLYISATCQKINVNFQSRNLCTLRKLFRSYVFILPYFTRFQKFFVEKEFEAYTDSGRC